MLHGHPLGSPQASEAGSVDPAATNLRPKAAGLLWPYLRRHTLRLPHGASQQGRGGAKTRKRAGEHAKSKGSTLDPSVPSEAYRALDQVRKAHRLGPDWIGSIRVVVELN